MEQGFKCLKANGSHPANLCQCHDTPKESRYDLPVATLHDRNDKIRDRIDIGRRFKHDRDRLKKLFEPSTNVVTATTFKKFCQP